MILNNNHNVIYLNSWRLEGMMNAEDGKTNLKELLTKTIKTYKDKIANGGEAPTEN